MTSSVKELETNVADQANANVAAATAARVETRTVLSKDVQRLEQQIKHHTSQVDQLSAAEQRLHDEIVAEEESAGVIIPDLKNQYRLFMNIANIEWDYADDNTIKGSAHMLNTREIRPFTLGAAEMASRVATADALWEVLGHDLATTA